MLATFYVLEAATVQAAQNEAQQIDNVLYKADRLIVSVIRSERVYCLYTRLVID